MTDLLAEILRLSRRMRREADRGPSAAELAGYLHLPLAEARAALARAKDLAATERADESKAGRTELPGGLIEALTEEEERTLGIRFGIEMNTDHTQEGAGAPFEVTGEHVRRIEAEALSRLEPKSPRDT